MTIQINLRLPDDFFKQAKEYATSNGFLNVQEFFREAAREKIFNNFQIRAEYLNKLNSKDANTLLSDSETATFEKELQKRTRQK